MANITHKMTLSTTEPNNDVGLIKVRQADDETQIFDVEITENGVIKPFVGLTPFFCLMAREVTGQGVSEEPVKVFDAVNGTLKYTLSANAMQMIGRNEAYFSFRKELSNGEWAEQFSTRSFNYTVEKSIYTQKFRDSNYWWTFNELYRIFNSYISSGKESWEDYVESNREILESIDPGGKVLTELIAARNGKPNLKTRIDDFESETNAQLAQNTKLIEDNAIKVESFTGLPHEKLQQAFDKAITEKKPLQIAKTYNIGANTITINKGSDVREPLFVFGGGKIIKDTVGFMFQGAVSAISDIFFHNIWFEGVEGIDVSVFDTGEAKLIRINTNMCYFKNVKDIFYSPTYFQDIKMNNDTIVKCSGAVLNGRGLFVGSMIGITMEQCTGQVIVKSGSGQSTDYSFNVIVKDSVIEDFYGATKPLFEFANGGITLENNYFEAIPNGVVKITGQGAVNAKGNVLLGETNGVPFATLGSSTYGVSELNNNATPNSPVVDATNLTGNARVLVSNNTSDFANIDPNKKIKDTSKDIINNDVVRVGNQYHGIKISKSIPDINKVDLCTIDFNATSGGYVTVKGGGIQGNVGVFGINKTFKITRSNSTLVVTADIDDSWGSSNLQKENVFLEIVGNTFVLRANGRTSLASVKYDLFVEIHGYTNTVTVH